MRVDQLAGWLRLAPLMARYGPNAVLGSYVLLNGFISIALMSLLALLTRQPFIFPSLGPTAFLLFYSPQAAAASPRNAFFGHLIGALSGYLALVVFGLTAAGPATSTGVDPARVGAAALSLGLTAGLMVWLRVPHAPAGATTLIVSLGILATPEQIAVLMVGVVILLVQGYTINRIAGIDYPLWSPSRGADGPAVPMPRATGGERSQDP